MWGVRARAACAAGVAVCLGGLRFGVAAGAQAPAEDSDGLAEVIVTAEKRAQSIQDVGVSVTAFDANSLAKLGLASATDVVAHVPGVQYNQFSPTMTVFNIRGVSQNDFTDHQEAPVAVYSDEVYVGAMGAIAGSLYDLERVEVLRGPQGTLFGRNATGGLIHYISVKPTSTPDGFLQLTGGSFGQFSTQGAFGGPVTDAIAARLSFATDRHDGIVHNRIGRDTNDQRQYSARLQVLLRLAQNSELLLKLYGTRNVDETGGAYRWMAAAPNQQGLGEFVGPDQNPWGTCAGCDLGGYRNPSSNPFDQAFDRRGSFDRTIGGITARLTWSRGDVDFTSVSDYLHLRKRYGEDTDTSPNFIFNDDVYQSYRQFSQEVRASAHVGRLQWIAGGYFLDMTSDDWAAASFADFLGGTTGTVFNVKTRSGALFGQLEWSLTEALRVIAGARLTRDEKTDRYTLFAPYPQMPVLEFNRATNPDLANRVFNMPSGVVALNYNFTPAVLGYVSVNRGVKSGGFVAPQAPPAPAPEQLVFNPEKLTSYEAGMKTTLFGGLARLNGAVFYYDYRDYQAYEQVGLAQVIRNLQAKVKGGELELQVAPARGLELQLGVSGLDSRVQHVTLPAGEIADRVMPQAPKWSVNALARYSALAFGGKWFVQADARMNTEEYFSTFNAPVDRESAYTVANVRAGYTNSSGNVEFAIFCNNVANRLYRIYDLDVSVLGFTNSVYANPRWAGATLTYHWQ